MKGTDGSVALLFAAGASSRVLVAELLGAEHRRECPRLTPQIAPRNPKYLTFPNHLCRLDALNRSPRRRRRSGSLHGPEPTLDVPVIGLDPVVRVSARSLSAAAVHMPLVLQFPNRRRIAA